MLKSREVVYGAVYNKVKNNIINASDISHHGLMDFDWLKDKASRRANISAVQNTNYFFHNQDKLEEFLND